jgi:hypothetical protein
VRWGALEMCGDLILLTKEEEAGDLNLLEWCGLGCSMGVRDNNGQMCDIECPLVVRQCLTGLNMMFPCWFCLGC